MNSLKTDLRVGKRLLVAGTPEGADVLLMAQTASKGANMLFVARDDAAMSRHADALEFFAPEVDVLEFPAWDCLPYDRVSPRAEIISQRINTLSQLLKRQKSVGRIVMTTVSALLQRVPARSFFKDSSLIISEGSTVIPDDLIKFLQSNGYQRSETVMEAGEYAIRGGIIDVYPSGAEVPSRLDFFGDELEQIRTFDPVSQRSHSGDEVRKTSEIIFRPMSEILLSDESIAHFRSQYRVTFGASGSNDPLYEAVSAGQRHIGMEHWLPLFHEKLETLFDYLPQYTLLILDHQVDEARDGRLDLIAEYYNARKEFAATTKSSGAVSVGSVYHPVSSEKMYLSSVEWEKSLSEFALGQLSPFSMPEGAVSAVDMGTRAGRDFADIRVQPGVNVYDALRDHVKSLQASKKRVVITAFSEGARDRLGAVLIEHGFENVQLINTWSEAEVLPKNAVGFAVTSLERGFVTSDMAIISEQDVLGERLGRTKRSKIRAENFISEASSLSENDLVVHVDHGVARFDGLITIEVTGAPHDCLRLVYSGNDKLFLPVENIEMISRYGSEDATAQLDKLGGVAWQARKAKLKNRIRDMADELIKIAAARSLRTTEKIEIQQGIYDEFCARFPYTETEDQARAIEQVIEDLASGRPVDRLVCGDVGFGKTEVALRAAFVVAMQGKQVAIITPTTLLSRQHFNNFTERFKGFPVQIRQLSRMVTAKQAKETKEGMDNGTVDIVIGTHALMAKNVKFRDLGLLIVDEEQHFGVGHKERLKQLKSDVHVLTLSATPIPRTMQLAMTGVKEMSLIATPPVDRLAVRTFILPYDPVVIREAILREKYRGGQTFYVCPRLADLDLVEEELRELIPEVKISVAHGRLSPTELEETISSFYDGAFDILLSTNIVESGLDLPSCNTIILHRADMYGLAQLYQLRGRVGRSKTRAYAYLTLPPKKKLTKTATKRLEVMQTLDTLGAGFTLASHDLDIRGAGNLLGEEQSGHIREVGIELYQQMLEEAVAISKGMADGGVTEQEWSPQIGIGMPVLIPEVYVKDLTVRMGLYRRLSKLDGREEIDGFAAELIDRFGPLPEEVENLIQTIEVKNLCKRAGIEKIDAGIRGAVVTFRNGEFANPVGLIGYLQDLKNLVKVRPDQKVVFTRNWETPIARLTGVKDVVRDLAKIAES